ncbi:MAG: hypothetical protein PHR00_01325 [Patescibacteria group bacterium]|nr:hypothetical protein [Patescibacteria group bacterium]
MNNKLPIIILIVFVLAAGLVIFYLSKNSDTKKVVPENNIIIENNKTTPSEPTKPIINTPTGTTLTPAQVEARKKELEPIINKAIEEKKIKVQQESKGRAFNEDELDFRTDAKTNVVTELVKKQVISEQDKTIILNK